MAYLGNTIVAGTLRVLNDINANKVSGDGSGLTTLNASNISSGTLDAARLPTSGASAGSYGPSAAVTGTNNTTMNVPYITVDAHGRVTSISNKVYTSKDTVYTHPTTAGNIHLPAGGASGNFLKWSSAGTGKWESLAKTEITTALGYTPPTTDTTYAAGTGLSLSGTTFNHSNSVTAGTAGTSSATSGSTLAVPYVTYDAQGHITAVGTHTHTVTGFLTSNGTAASATKLATPRAIDGVNFDGSAAIIHYGTCSTAAATAAKTVACTSYTLVTGSRIVVKFTVTNTAASPTLNVNSTGAKAIQYRGAAITAGYLAANRTYEFIYDGTNYQLVGDIDTNTTYSAGTAALLEAGTDTAKRVWSAKILVESLNGIKTITTGSTDGTISVEGTDIPVKGLGSAAYKAATYFAIADHTHNYAGSSSAGGVATSAAKLETAVYIDGVAFNGTADIAHFGTCTTAAATVAKTVACTGFALKTGAVINVKFSNAITVDLATLDVNSTGAKAIYYRGAALPANVVSGGSVVKLVYNGTQYDMVGNWDVWVTD